MLIQVSTNYPVERGIPSYTLDNISVGDLDPTSLSTAVQGILVM